MADYSPATSGQFTPTQVRDEFPEVEKALNYRRENLSYYTTFHTNNKTFFEN